MENRPSSRIKTSSDWSNLFSIPRTLDYNGSTTNVYSRYGSSGTASTTPPSSRRNYPSSYSTGSSADYYSNYTSASSSLYSTSYLQSRRPFTSRFLRRTHHTSSSEEDEGGHNEASQSSTTSQINEGGEPEQSRKVRYHKQGGAVLNNGRTVIRLRREVSSDEPSSSSESQEEPETEEPEEEPEPEEPEPPPEDPLDKEERELNEQLMLSLTLTLVDEENIRQRLLEIKKARLRKNQETLETNLVQKFINDTEVTLFENLFCSSKEEEERVLEQKLKSSELAEVDRKDVQVRLQELFHEKKNILEGSLRSIEGTYEHILQETSTELTELETSINNKAEMVQRLQDEILSMTVRKELLSKAMEQINENHQQKAERLRQSIGQIEAKSSEYAVMTTSPETGQGGKSIKKLSEIEQSDELREIERELECPVCMDIARPPIYQCEEGHIICANCKPLLTECPHNCGKKYSEPAIRCRFAEKLAEKYASQLAKHNK